MPIVLGAVTLPEGMVWGDRNAFAMVSQGVHLTLGGRPAVFTIKLLAGRSITLMSLPDQGWLTMAQVNLLQAMAEEPGSEFQLTIEGMSRGVVFRHNEPPAFEAVPIIPRSEPLEGDLFIGTIKLLTI